jgi:hypothetical protein
MYANRVRRTIDRVLSEDERKRFKMLLLEKGMNMRQFCDRHSMNYRTFRVEFCGGQNMRPEWMNIVRLELLRAKRTPEEFAPEKPVFRGRYGKGREKENNERQD